MNFENVYDKRKKMILWRYFQLKACIEKAAKSLSGCCIYFFTIEGACFIDVLEYLREMSQYHLESTMAPAVMFMPSVSR